MSVLIIQVILSNYKTIQFSLILSTRLIIKRNIKKIINLDLVQLEDSNIEKILLKIKSNQKMIFHKKKNANPFLKSDISVNEHKGKINKQQKSFKKCSEIGKFVQKEI